MMSEDRKFIASLNLKGKTLDVGSLDVNGNIRDCMTEYFGIDFKIGKNVDIQCSSHFLPFKDSTFDNVISIGTLEHDCKFWKSVDEIKRVLKSGGKFILSVPNYSFSYHAYPKDYWHFSIDSFDVFFDGFTDIIIHSKQNDNCMRAVGIKK